MSLQAESSREHGHRRQSEQSHGYWSSSEDEEVRFPGCQDCKANLMFYSSEEETTTKRVEKHVPNPEEEEVRFCAGSQRKANSWILYSSDEEEATRKRVEKHMPNSMDEEGGSAASKRRGRCRILNRKARPKEEDTTKGVRKYKSKFNKRRKLILKRIRKAQESEETRNIIAEFNKIPSERIVRTRMFSQQALDYYNRKHRTNFVLWKPLMANMINLGAERVLYHVNFTAKKYDEKDAELFFAEVVAARQLRVDEPKRFCLRVCTMLDANNGIETSCRGCAPELMLQHPFGGFSSECKGPYIEHRYYLTPEGELGGFRFNPLP